MIFMAFSSSWLPVLLDKCYMASGAPAQMLRFSNGCTMLCFGVARNTKARSTAASVPKAKHAHSMRWTPWRPRSPFIKQQSKNVPIRYTLKPVRFEAAVAVRHAPDQLPAQVCTISLQRKYYCKFHCKGNPIVNFVAKEIIL